MPHISQKDDFTAQFEEKLRTKDSLLLKTVERDPIIQDEATEYIHEVWESLFDKQVDETIEDNTLMFHDYLEAIASKAKGFTYVIASDEHNQCNGIVWMTPTMRCNFERFGSYISIDCMKRELNTMAWPYFAISLKNELNKICVGCEVLLFQKGRMRTNF